MGHYSLLSDGTLSALATIRRLGSFSSFRRRELISLLQAADRDDPGYLEKVAGTPLRALPMLGGVQIRLYAALSGIDCRILPPDVPERDLTCYVRVRLETRRGGSSVLAVAGEVALDAALLSLGTDLGLLPFLPLESKRRILAAGSLDFFGLRAADRLRSRFLQIRSSPLRYEITLLYPGPPLDDDELIECLRNDLHPAEPRLLELGRDEEVASRLAEEMGILVPLSASNLFDYLVTNLGDYRAYLERPEGKKSEETPESLAGKSPAIAFRILSSLDDRKIVETMEAFFPYASRRELVETAVDRLRRPGFFTPLVRRTERAENATTTLLTALEDSDTLMVAEGTLLRYRLYELPELAQAFSAGLPRRPENPHSTFSSSELSSLSLLLSEYDDEESIALSFLLLSCLETPAGKKSAEERRAELAGRPDAPLVRDFLRGIFDFGMYMRRWRGPGNLYPLRPDETRAGLDPQLLGDPQAALCQSLLDSMTDSGRFVLALPTFFLYLSRVTPGHKTLGEAWHDVHRGDVHGGSCIRASSDLFVLTGAHHLFTLFGESIPDFAPSRLEKVV